MEEVKMLKDFVPGGGAQFWVYISGQNNTKEILKTWRVRIEHETSDWCVQITDKEPIQMIHTPNLFGKFFVHVYASGTTFEEKQLDLKDDPTIRHDPNVSCRVDNAGMIGITVTENGKDAEYWTISNAYSNL